MKKLNVWRHISNNSISAIKEARVLDGDSSYFLNFDHQEIEKDCLGYLVPNYVIKKNLYKRLKNLQTLLLLIKLNVYQLILTTSTPRLVYQMGKIKTSLVVAADSRFSKYVLKWAFRHLVMILKKI